MPICTSIPSTRGRRAGTATSSTSPSGPGRRASRSSGRETFTHPAWQAELKEKLVPAEPGLFRLRPDLERFVEEQLPAACRSERTTTRFMLSVEISTIYKKLDKTRKIHHLIYTPDFDAMERVTASLDRIGNIKSDGRPILGLDSRHLLEIALESDPGSYLVPAHIWTPWFAALGSKSGFDAIDDCYGDLAPHIFAVETGLSSDPPMNWRVSSLDRFRLVSNSDAHSPEKLGREVCVFDTDLDYFALRRALETGEGYGGTLEFFPEEGKYHLDGHRSCDVRLSPNETRRYEGICPVCGKPLTVGVMHRVEDLADRPEETAPPATAGAMQSLIPLPEILSEIHQVGAKSRRVAQHYESLLGQLGPELPLLNAVPLEDIRPASSSLVAEAVSRLRRQEVVRHAGYDGVYGTIRLFEDAELRRHTRGASLFAEEQLSELPAQKGAASRPANAPSPPHLRGEHASLPSRNPPPAAPTSPAAPVASAPRAATPAFTARPDDVLAGLDPDQRRAAEITTGPLLIVAGPGSGKTRTLTHRIAHLVLNHGVSPSECLAITFTRRAAGEMRETAADPPAGRMGSDSAPHVSLLRFFDAPRALERGRPPARLPGRVGDRAGSAAPRCPRRLRTKGARAAHGDLAGAPDHRCGAPGAGTDTDTGRRRRPRERGRGGISTGNGSPEPGRFRRPRHPDGGPARVRAGRPRGVSTAAPLRLDRRISRTWTRSRPGS